MKDIFIDTNVAKNFQNPLDPEYKKLLLWLKHEGVWVVSQKLLVEYGRTNQNIAVLVNLLLSKGRLRVIPSEEHKAFKLTKREEKGLCCNHEDHWHLRTVFLSYRKIAIAIDENFRNDINGFRKIDGIQPQAVSRPEQIDYENLTVY